MGCFFLAIPGHLPYYVSAILVTLPQTQKLRQAFLPVGVLLTFTLVVFLEPVDGNAATAAKNMTLMVRGPFHSSRV